MIERIKIAASQNDRGFSLVELMVAMVLGLAIVVAVSYIFLQSRTGYRVQDGSTRMQEDIRFVQDIMTRDLRSSGFFGCPNLFDYKPTDPLDPQSANLRLTGVHPFFRSDSATWLEKDGTNNDAVSYANLSYLFRGFDGGASWPVTATTSGRRQANSDTLMIMKVDNEGRKLTSLSPVTSSYSTPTTLTIASAIPGLTTNGATAVMVVSSCAQGAEIIKPTVQNGGLRFELDNTLNVSRDASARIAGLKMMPHSSDVMISRFSPVTYYVGSAASSPSTGLPTLYRLGIQDRQANDSDNGLWVANGVGDIVASGVENMQLRYLIDSDGDGVPDTYMTSTQIDALGNANLYWQRVSAVEVTLTFITPDGVRTMTESQTAQGVTTVDSKLRQVVRFTVDLRNGSST